MKKMSISWIFLLAILATACASRQDISRIEGPRPTMICIVEHTAVRGEGVLPAIQDGIAKKGLQSRVVPGTYEKRDKLWQPHFDEKNVAGCDALLFYVANWNWDIAWYMYFASIWMTDGGGEKSIARATYDASLNAGPGKFINAREKNLELVDLLLSEKATNVSN